MSYILTERRVRGGQLLKKWEAHNGLPMTYPQAHDLLLAESHGRPELHMKGARTFLSAEPDRQQMPVMWQPETPDVRPAVTL